jgi:hypothetical protein
MTSIVASGAMAVTFLFVALLVFFALARGVGEDDDYEIEVKLFPPTIRRKVKRNDRRHLSAEAVQEQQTVSRAREIESDNDGTHDSPCGA